VGEGSAAVGSSGSSGWFPSHGAPGPHLQLGHLQVHKVSACLVLWGGKGCLF
jgi:hypothetical protein